MWGVLCGVTIFGQILDVIHRWKIIEKPNPNDHNWFASFLVNSEVVFLTQYLQWKANKFVTHLHIENLFQLFLENNKWF